MSSQRRRDFRRMLYRLDLATSYPSIPALIQHFMDETALDGVVEVKMVASPPMPAPMPTKGKRSNKPPPPPLAPLQPVTSVISFRREGRDVNAIALFGPASVPSSMFTGEEQGGLPRNLNDPLAFLDLPGMVVKKRYPPRTTLVWVFAPLVQKLLDEGADTVTFEVRSYIAGADSVREVQSTLSPVSPYGTAHSTTEASPSVLASGSTPSSGGQGSGLEDLPAIQYGQSPIAYPHADNKAPILTELHRRPQELRTESTYESPRPLHYSPTQGQLSTPVHPSGSAVPQWSLPQPTAWNTASGYSDLQPLPEAPSWNSSLSSEGWSEQPGSWQSESAPASYGYPTIPSLPWQALQESSYTPGALDPTPDPTYFGAVASPSFHEGYYMPHAGLSNQPGFPTDTHEAGRGGETPTTAYGSPGAGFQGDHRATNWQAQYPYLGALNVPSSETFSYSPVPHDRSGEEIRTSEFDQRPSTGSPTSPPDSSERDSLTPTLTNPGFERAPAPPPQKQWPFPRWPSNQPSHWQRSTSAYTPVSPSLSVSGPGTSRSFSAMLPRSRIRLRSGSPEPAREASIRGAKRLKVSPTIASTSHLQPPDVTSPLPVSAGSSGSAHRSLKSRGSSTVRSGSAAHRSHRTTSPTEATQDQQEADSSLLEILGRPAPYKRMLGYAARQHDGSIVAYELADAVAATTFNDTLLGLGLSSVTNVAALGMELGRRAALRQQEPGSRGAAGHDQASAGHTYGEHGIQQQPQGGDGRTGHFRGAISRPAWQGCVIAGYV